MRTFNIFLFCIFSLVAYGQRGTVSTFLNDPNADIDDALALDSEGNLYGSNFAGTSVYKITPSGDVSTFATGFANPNGLAVDSDDNLFIVEYSGGAIHKYDNDGNLLRTYNVGGFPSGLVRAHRSDNMIFTNADFAGVGTTNGVFELNTTDGSVTTIYQGAPLEVPVGLTYGPGGILYIGDYASRIIYKVTRSGDLEYVAIVPAPNNFVPFLAFITYANGFLYGTIYGEHKIYRINPRRVDDVEIYSGSVQGDMDGSISDATYSFPAGILANRSGREIYVSDFSGAGNIRKISRRRSMCRNGSESDVAAHLDANLAATLTTYLNPATDYLNIQLDGSLEGEYSIEVYDVLLRKVYDSKITSDGSMLDETIPLTGWMAGVYEVVISNGPQKFTKKVVVE